MILKLKNGIEIKANSIAEHISDIQRHMSIVLDDSIIEDQMDFLKSVFTPENISEMTCILDDGSQFNYSGYSYINRITSDCDEDDDFKHETIIVDLYSGIPNEYEDPVF